MSSGALRPREAVVTEAEGGEANQSEAKWSVPKPSAGVSSPIVPSDRTGDVTETGGGGIGLTHRTSAMSVGHGGRYR